jgi:hypothetical protein
VVVVKRHAAIALIGLVAVLAAPLAAAAPEYHVKAAFLYNFAKFVEWPPDAIAPEMRVCVFGGDPFGRALPETLAGKSVSERPLTVAYPATVRQLSDCHVLFVGASEDHELPRLLPSLAGTGVLTVGESDEFARQGGIITFRRERSKVRFEINETAAERAGLRISSQLLKLATRVTH